MTITSNSPVHLPPFDELAAALPYDERPSIVANRPWLHAQDASDHGGAEDPGKWLIFAPRERIDRIWGAVRQLTERGLIGPVSKVSTAMVNPLTSDDSHVICCYVRDWHDSGTIRDVLATLRGADIAEGWLNFKRDADTLAGVYAGTGTSPVAVFTAPPDAVRFYTRRLGDVTWLDGSNDAEVVAAIEAADLIPVPDDDDWCGT